MEPHLPSSLDHTSSSAASPTSAPAITTATRPVLTTSSNLQSSLIAINVTAEVPLKLNATNYCAWRAQFDSFLIGYDLYGYVDGSLPCPSATIRDPNSQSEVPNPTYSFWIRQDKLLLNAIIGSLTASLVPFIAAKKTSFEAWKSLEKTYASPSRGRIMELRSKLANPVKGSRFITEYMQEIQSCIDSLAFMGKLVDFDELSIGILNGLDDSYTNLSSVIQVREIPIEFDELLEKLLHVEARLKLSAKSFLPKPAKAFAAPAQSNFGRQNLEVIGLSTNTGPNSLIAGNKINHTTRINFTLLVHPSPRAHVHLPLMLLPIVAIKGIAKSADLLAILPASVASCLPIHGILFLHRFVAFCV